MALKTGVELIAAERKRHVSKGYTADHDDEHSDGELAEAGCYYALSHDQRAWLDNSDLFEKANGGRGTSIYPFAPEQFKPYPNNRIKELAIAGAFIAAEIDRLQRSDINL